MRPVSLVLVLLVALLALLPGALVKPLVEPAAAAPGSVAVALEGDPSWLGGPSVLENFGPPDINDAGTVAFYAREYGGACAVLRSDVLPAPIAADNGPPDPTIGNLSFCPVLNEPVIINAAGHVAFSAEGYGTTVCTSPPCKGIFVGTAPSAYTLVAYEGMPEPGGGGTLGPPILLDMDDADNVLYAAEVAPGIQGLFVSGAASALVKTGDTILPEAGGGNIADFGNEDGSFILGGVAGSCFDTLDNGGGDGVDGLDPDCRFAVMDNSTPDPIVVFHAMVSGGPPEQDGIYRVQEGGPIQDVVLAGITTWQSDPSFGSTFEDVDGDGRALGQPSINDNNQAAFWGESTGPYGAGFFVAEIASPHEDGNASCYDGIDNGGDGSADEQDDDCTTSTDPYEDGSASCKDSTDNGGDGLTDTADPDCAVASKAVLEEDPSVLGDSFGGGGCAFGLEHGLGPNGLNDTGQVVVVGCGGDPVDAIITTPHLHKQVIMGENLGGGLGSVVSVGNPSISAGSPSTSSQLAWSGDITSGGACTPNPDCSGVFKLTDSCTVDSDGDGLPNCWEVNGIDINNDGTKDLDLPAMGANVNKKDIFIEVDYMDCSQWGCASEDGAGLGTCGDGLDNGNDGSCDTGKCPGNPPADADCQAVGGDTHHHRPIDETVWNYEDGAGSGSCGDGKDNGNDGLSDGSDPDCAVTLAVASLAEDGFPPGTCNDNVDNGNDGNCDTGSCTGPDAGKPADPDCSVGTVVQASANAPVGTGINLHVLVDEAIPHQQYMNFWVPEDGFSSCRDGIDNGGDGRCDVGGCAGNPPADPDCMALGLGFEDQNASCTDGRDNGGDGTCDTAGCLGLPADPDCGVYDFDGTVGKATYFGTSTERGHVNNKWLKKAKRQVFHYLIFTHQQHGQKAEDGTASCSDGIDNGGGDGFDGNDVDCQALGDGYEDGNGSCFDGIDNGGSDGLIDAADPDCKSGGSSGLAEIWGNDFMVSLGGFAHEDGAGAVSCFDGVDNGGGDGADLADSDCTSGVAGNQMEHEGTFMHELGHNLGLRHGGNDDINYKPNYLSVMSYTFQFDWIVGSGNRPLDYSRWVLPFTGGGPGGPEREDGFGVGSCVDVDGDTNPIDNGGDTVANANDPDCAILLDESDLNEDRGIDTWSSPANPPGWNTIWTKTAYTFPIDRDNDGLYECPFKVTSIVDWIDWLLNKTEEGNTVPAPHNTNVQTYLNDPQPDILPAPVCDSFQALWGFADWPALKYDFRPAPNYSDGLPNAPLPPDEGEAAADGDGDGFADLADNCPNNANPGQENADEDQLGDDCDNCPSDYNPTQTNTDGHDLGDACDDDDDDDGFKDTEEDTPGGNPDPLEASETPEVCDGDDDDGDTLVDEGFPDTNTDGEADCHDDDFDADSDGTGNASDLNDDDNPNADPFTDDTENYVGTDKEVMCAAGGADNDPLDITKDGQASIADIMNHFAFGEYGTEVAKDDQPYKRRLDLNADKKISIADIMQYFAFGQYGKVCPY